MRKLILCLALALLALHWPAGAVGAQPATPAGQCKALKTSLGPALFKQTFGTTANRSNAFGRCVSSRQRAEQANLQNASKTCRAERLADPAAFKDQYGTGPNKANAFGRCVSQHARAQSQAQQQAIVNAARTCKAERMADPAAFKDHYGTGPNKSNAFGKCVSQHARS